MKHPLRSGFLLALAACAALAPAPAPASPAPRHDPGTQAREPRGQKLVLKDGSFQLVRSYQRNGDRVRYLSAERGDWEEIPAALVDWEATKKAEAASQVASEAMLEKIHQQEEAQKVQVVMDVDASLQVAPGVFLPPGEGLFAIDGKHVLPLEQVGSAVKVDRKQQLKQILSPVPIIPSKHHVEIPGPASKARITTGQPEFYLREAPPDPDHPTPIRHMSRPGESGPELVLVRATVKGGKRQLETIRSFLGAEISKERNEISIQRWEIAPTVFRFTLGERLPPGEYAVAEIMEDGMSLFVWDFAVNGPAGTPSGKP